MSSTGGVRPAIGARGVQPVTDRFSDLQNSERVMQGVRAIGVVFAVVQILSYRNMPYPPGFQRAGLLEVATLGFATAAMALAHRRVQTIGQARLLALMGLAVDIVVCSSIVWLYAFDNESAIWSLLYLLPLEGAIRFGLVGSLASWATVTVGYVARELWGSRNYDYLFQPESVSYRMGVALLIALVAGLMARNLVQQRSVAEGASRRYADLVEGLDAIVWESDPGTHTYSFVSQEAGRLLGYPLDEWFAPGFWRAHLHPEDVERAIAHTESYTKAGMDHEHEYRMIAADGRQVWLHDVAKVERTPSGAPMKLRGIMVDVTERKQAESALRDSEERFRTAFNGAGTGMALVGIDARFLRVNQELVRLTGYAESDLLASSFLSIAHPDDQASGRSLLRRMLAGAQRSFLYETRYLHKGGATVWVLVSASLVTDEEDRPIYFIAQFQDITERKRAEEMLEHQALHDPLTGLPNRTLLMDRLATALGRSKRSGAHASVLYMDLDGFKLVNDSMGHEAGDALLVAAARRIQSVLRPQDTAARMGGDEFVIVCEDVEHAEDASRIAERVSEVLSMPYAMPDGETYVSASIGLAMSTTNDDSPETLLRDADAALYRAKELGKARVEMFDGEFRQEAAGRLKLATALHRAREREEFRLVYQPLVELETNSYVGVEALLRWQPPDGPLLPPSEFIPFAESSGLIVPIGEWALTEACRQAARWRSERQGRTVDISVNLSPRQLNFPDLAKRIETILEENDTDPQRLLLEITEEALIADVDTTIATLRKLRAVGVRIWVDDFGTGYSSLNYLKRLEVDALKIDASFVDGLGRDAEDTAIVTAIVSMAKALGLATVAEGVETAQQLAGLRDLGCDLAQGFYFSIPRDGDDLAAILDRGPVLVNLSERTRQ